METIGYIVGGVVGAVVAFYALLKTMGIVVIGEHQVGIVVKKMSTKSLPTGRIVALNGEAGVQADTLSPGWHFFLWPWQYKVHKEDIITINPDEIGLVIAVDGDTLPQNRILGKAVECSHFQDARSFLTNGGQKGKQTLLLTSGTHRINTGLFEVITTENCKKYGLTENQLRVQRIDGTVGIVTTLEGESIDDGDIAGPMIQGHENFQNPEAFISKNGKKGLQEQVLLSGSWNINPWFAKIKTVPLTEIPIGHVGVVVSYVGKSSEDVSGKEFKHGNIVKVGDRGVWDTPLYPGKHPINTEVMKVEEVPTTNIVLNWASRTESHALDEKLSSITVRSKDGFAFNLDVSQIIHVAATNAPKVISRVGSMSNLVDHVLEPLIGNYFRNSAQDHSVLDFLNARTERQKAASLEIKTALDGYDVEAIDTLIGDITPPADLMKTQTDRKISTEQQATYKVQLEAQKQRQDLVRETANADLQRDVVTAEQGVKISKLKADQALESARGEAESTKVKAEAEATSISRIGDAKAQAYTKGVQAMGSEGYSALQIMQVVGEKGIKVTPDTLITGSQDGGSTVLNSLLSLTLKDRLAVTTVNGVRGKTPEKA